MRITNKIMQNNSLYNINNNKITEDQLNTMMSTGKKLTRPSDDPVIAIRALRLRSNVTQLSQYYEKNAKDAESWLDVTADALSTITSVLTDSVKQATKGANKDLTLDDLNTIITQMEALAKEYYSTGNADYAGRYIFTGYRTDTALTFDNITTADYTDINDEFNAADISESKRVLNKHLLDSSTILDDATDAVVESSIVERTVGRIRLSYNNLNYVKGDGNIAELKFREELAQPATSTVDAKVNTINLNFKTNDGVAHSVSVPVNDEGFYDITSEGIHYTATTQKDGSYKVEATDPGSGKYFGKVVVSPEGSIIAFDGNIEEAEANVEAKNVTTITFTGDKGQTQIKLPILPAIGQTYKLNLDVAGYTATVNSDGTFTIEDSRYIDNGDGTRSATVINVTNNGSIHSSYTETTITMEAADIIYATSSEQEVDNAYNEVYSGKTMAVLNALTGEVILSEKLKNRLSTLPDLLNAKTIDVVYDKKEWVQGDIKPENLFSCAYTYQDGIGENGSKTILYNRGSAPHDIAYDVGFAQSVVVNTTAESVFSTSVKRDVEDLSRIFSELKQVDNTLKTLSNKLESTVDKDLQAKLKTEIDSTQKAFDYLREQLQEEFEHKITSNQKALDVANVAVTANGTRSKRLDLVTQRLMNQTTTFKALQSDNEDVDLAEAATKLTTAQVTYEASLMATGKISQSSLINYI
jgi:flagellar hook-associated protein 3 FlgL